MGRSLDELPADAFALGYRSIDRQKQATKRLGLLQVLEAPALHLAIWEHPLTRKRDGRVLPCRSDLVNANSGIPFFGQGKVAVPTSCSFVTMFVHGYMNLHLLELRLPRRRRMNFLNRKL